MSNLAAMCLLERWTLVLSRIAPVFGAGRISLGDIFLCEIVLLGTFPTALKTDPLDKHSVIKTCYLLQVLWEF